jgi:hypothetical protein
VSHHEPRRKPSQMAVVGRRAARALRGSMDAVSDKRAPLRLRFPKVTSGVISQCRAALAVKLTANVTGQDALSLMESRGEQA